MIFLLLVLLIPVALYLAYCVGRRAGETVHVNPTSLYVTLDPALIKAVLEAEGWVVSPPPAPTPPKIKPH